MAQRTGGDDAAVEITRHESDTVARNRLASPDSVVEPVGPPAGAALIDPGPLLPHQKTIRLCAICHKMSRQIKVDPRRCREESSGLSMHRWPPQRVLEGRPPDTDRSARLSRATSSRGGIHRRVERSCRRRVAGRRQLPRPSVCRRDLHATRCAPSTDADGTARLPGIVVESRRILRQDRLDVHGSIQDRCPTPHRHALRIRSNTPGSGGAWHHATIMKGSDP